MSGTPDHGGRTYREIHLGIWATDADADELMERITRLLCPDPDHAPPCPIPWEIGSRPLDPESPDAESLREQVRHEYGEPPA